MALEPDRYGRPTLLLDFNHILLLPDTRGKPVKGRDGLQHLLSLLPYFRLGAFTLSGQESTEAKVIFLEERLRKNPLLRARSCHAISLCSPTVSRCNR